MSELEKFVIHLLSSHNSATLEDIKRCGCLNNISKHYLKKEDVLEAISEVEELPIWEDEAFNAIDEVKSKLNLGETDE